MATTPVTHLVEDGHFVSITKGKEVRLRGTLRRYDREAGGMVDVEYDVAFAVGDEAEYDSYNLSYIGRIVSVGPSTVTIDTGDGPNVRKRRLKLREFSWRNRTFDAAEAKRKNAVEMMCI